MQKHVCLGSKYKDLSSNERILFLESVGKIDEIWDKLPDTFKKRILKKYESSKVVSLIDLIQRRIYLNIINNLSKFMKCKALYFMKIGWIKLITHCRCMKGAKNEVKMVIKIQSRCRCFMSQLRYHDKKKQIKDLHTVSSIYLLQEVLPVEPHWLQHGIQGIEFLIRIQKLYRGFRTRKNFSIMQLQNDSTKIIQQKWRNFQLAQRIILYQLIAIKRRNSANVLQAWFRQIRAKILKNYVLHLKYIQRRGDAKRTKEKKVSMRFIRFGAAQKIVSWFKVLASKPCDQKEPLSSKHQAHVIDLLTKTLGSTISIHDLIGFKRLEKLRRSNAKTRSEQNQREEIFSAFNLSSYQRFIVLIQTLWRSAISRKRMWTLCLLHFEKIVSNNETFWHNKKTQRSMKNKPSFFYHHDITNPIQYPEKDVSLEHLCDLCGKTTATWVDANDCEAFCDSCNVKIHSTARSRNNVVFPILICFQCNTQMASKKCLVCDQYFCDHCFRTEHDSPMLGLHPFHCVLRHCDRCCGNVSRFKVKNGGDRYCVECLNFDIHDRPTSSEHIFNSKYEKIDIVSTVVENFVGKMKK